MWAVDLEEPSVTGWVLRAGRWSDEQRAVGDEPSVATTTFAVTVLPASLL